MKDAAQIFRHILDAAPPPPLVGNGVQSCSRREQGTRWAKNL
jgi:hypothetical protein